MPWYSVAWICAIIVGDSPDSKVTSARPSSGRADARDFLVHCWPPNQATIGACYQDIDRLRRVMTCWTAAIPTTAADAASTECRSLDLSLNSSSSTHRGQELHPRSASSRTARSDSATRTGVADLYVNLARRGSIVNNRLRCLSARASVGRSRIEGFDTIKNSRLPPGCTISATAVAAPVRIDVVLRSTCHFISVVLHQIFELVATSCISSVRTFCQDILPGVLGTEPGAPTCGWWCLPAGTRCWCT